MLHVQLQMSMLTRVTMGTMGTKIHPKALHLQLTIRMKILTQGNPPKTHMLGSQQKIHMPDNLPKTLMLVSQLRKTHTMQESQRRIHTMQLKTLTQGVSQRSLTRLMEEMVEEVKRRLLLLKELWLEWMRLGQVVPLVLQVEKERKVLLARLDLREPLGLLVCRACLVLQGLFLTFSLTSTGSRCLRE